jgi:hypothetical protein
MVCELPFGASSMRPARNSAHAAFGQDRRENVDRRQRRDERLIRARR